MAFRPKTRRCYELLFRNFVGFCLCNATSLYEVSLEFVLAYLEYLTQNKVSVPMLANNISALKAHFTMYNLQFSLFDHPRVRYFVKALKINRPLALVTRNIMSLQQLQQLVLLCDLEPDGMVFKSIFLLAFFGFLRISNLAPHAVGAFDCTRHITRDDIEFHSQTMAITLKWSKTIQTRDRIHVVTLPRPKGSPLCPVRALKLLLRAYNPSFNHPLFNITTSSGFQVLTDTRIQTFLAKMNFKMGLPSNHFTFHTFRRSGATLAYNAHMPIQSIKHHGSWTSDCVWTYIQQDGSHSRDIAAAFVSMVNNM